MHKFAALAVCTGVVAFCAPIHAMNKADFISAMQADPSAAVAECAANTSTEQQLYACLQQLEAKARAEDEEEG
jgi:hypothetical protein